MILFPVPHPNYILLCWFKSMPKGVEQRVKYPRVLKKRINAQGVEERVKCPEMFWKGLNASGC